MTRIIAGEWGGRRLRTPRGDGTRPTSDRVRESMFASLTSALGSFEGLRVLDLFAGSGALGLEAASRGAAHVDLVESDRRAAEVVERNVEELDAPATVHDTTVERFVGDVGEAWDLVLVDPPYAVTSEAVAGLLAVLVDGGGVAADGLVVVERSSRTPFAWPEGLEAVRDKAYGETRLWYGRPHD